MNNTAKYYSDRIKLEKLKQKTCRLVIVGGLLFFLALAIDCYLKRP